MRILPLAATLLIALAFVPAASASCLAEVHGLCVRDPGTNPCDSVLSCEACFATVPLCVHVDRCLAGDLWTCVDYQAHCLHSWCPPPWA